MRSGEFSGEPLERMPFDPKAGSKGPSCCTRVIFATIAVAAIVLALVAAATIVGQYVSALSILPETLGVFGQLEVTIPVLAVSLPVAAVVLFLSCRRLCSSNKPRLPERTSPLSSSDDVKVDPPSRTPLMSPPPTPPSDKDEGYVSPAPNADHHSEVEVVPPVAPPIAPGLSSDTPDEGSMSERDSALKEAVNSSNNPRPVPIPESEDESEIEIPFPVPPGTPVPIEEERCMTPLEGDVVPVASSSKECDLQQLESYSYRDFSTHKACSDKRVADNYLVSWMRGLDMDLTWIQFLPKEIDEATARRLNKVAKIHISIDRGEENMEKAFSVIFPLLVSRGIKAFKIVPRKMLADPARLGNPEGKEFVLYLLDESEEMLDHYQTLFRDMLGQLNAADVVPGKPSSGDALIPGGEGFFYTRAPVNVNDQYLAADFLKKADFTRYESAHISPSLAFRLQLGAEAAIEKPEEIALESVVLNPDLTVVGMRAKKLQESYFQDLSLLCGRSPALFMMLFGSGVSVEEFDDVADPTLFQRAFYHFLESFQFYDVVGGSRVKEDFLKEQLARAAKLSAAVQVSLNVERRQEFGNILPAIYHHFLVQWKQREGEGAGRPLFASIEDEEKFIVEVVKCSLRVRGVQNESMEPRFCVETSDRALDTFIREAMAQGLDSLVETEEGEQDLRASDLTSSLREEGWVMIKPENDSDLITTVAGIDVKDDQGVVRSPTPNTLLEYVMGYLPFSGR